jgi:hypothetical protein
MKNIKNIAYIQDYFLLSNEQIKKYMGEIQNLTSDNIEKIYKFIICCNKSCKITKFCLNINSEILFELNKLIENNRILDKCIFVATRSNSNLVRDIIAKNIYFSLSDLNIILNNYKNIEPFKVMTIVSDLNTPFYNQIYIEGPKPAYRLSELTVEKVNEFVDKGDGIDLLIALDDSFSNEIIKLSKILLDPACKYKNFASFIELELINKSIFIELKKKLASINNIASNVSICGLTNSYPDLSSLTLYTNCAIQIVNNFRLWSIYINNSIIFNRFTEKNKNKTSSIINKQILDELDALPPVAVAGGVLALTAPIKIPENPPS